MDKTLENEMAFLQQIISSIRTIRSEMNVPPGKKAQLIYRSSDNDAKQLLEEHTHYLTQLAGID
jgi:valyl-tRNA synthetase